MSVEPHGGVMCHKNLVHQVGDQARVILRCTVNQPSRSIPMSLCVSESLTESSHTQVAALQRALNAVIIQEWLCGLHRRASQSLVNDFDMQMFLLNCST